ncbi:MAG: hypothetical protein KGI37_03935 [Alphaproteobacteria bacterium]|nr:hypothetical protein [Alphaproteobacteria bacterium]
MDSSVSSVSGYGGVAFAPSSSGDSSASLSAAAPSNTTTTSAPFQNPRIVNDPSVGVITEYLSVDGNLIVSQTPSAAAVAYLRQGLTAQGFTKTASETGGVTA